ncbi:hypothetical protein DFAR_2400006 [Desulfarculales bacterium]
MEDSIVYRISGTLPIHQGSGTLSYEVNGDRDNWLGWIPLEQIPHDFNPTRGGLGIYNRKVMGHDLPPLLRLLPPRLRAPLPPPRKASGRSRPPGPGRPHWQYQRDAKNLLAVQVTPGMAQALLAAPEARDLGEILAG